MKFLEPYGSTMLSSSGARSSIRCQLAVERCVALTSLRLAGPLVASRCPHAGTRTYRSDRRTLTGGRLYSVPLHRGSTQTIAKPPLKAAHRGLGLLILVMLQELLIMRLRLT